MAVGVSAVLASAVVFMVAAAGASAADPIFVPTGPPFPPPVAGRRVYDYRRIFSAAAIADAEAQSHAIEDRSGAQVVVYTQSVPYDVSQSEARDQAAALGNQWGVGRSGFNDGVVLLFDIDPSGIHGKVAIVGGDGFRNAYLPDSDAQRIVDQQIIPRLIESPPNFDQALHDALAKLDAAVSPAHVQALSAARTLNAIAALIVAPLLFLLLVGAAVVRWIRYGKDPVYLDDPSILMPAPPEKLTAADAALIVEGRSTRRALTTALLDLASRGQLSFEDSRSGLLGTGHQLGIHTDPAKGDPTIEAQRALNARRPIGGAEKLAYRKLTDLAGASGEVPPEKVPSFGKSVDEFDKALEAQVVRGGWYAKPPSEVIARARRRAIAEVVGGGIVAWASTWLAFSGALVVGLAVVAAGVVTFILSGWMPTVTMPGAMVRAMLAAYRRTLQKTMDQARSMQQVVTEAKLPWLETPDQAVVWGTALGLNAAIEGVLARTLSDVQSQRVAPSAVWFPVWYGSPISSGGAAGGAPGGSLFSGSAVPDFGGMFNVLGSIGNSPSSKGGGGFGGGGGFSGGGGGSGSF
jgi:uncharacterized membrane protein YgcG